MLKDVVKNSQETMDLDSVKENILNWQVFEKPLLYTDLDGSTLVTSDKKITYRVVDNNGQPELIKLGEVSARYNVLQNEHFVEMDRPIFESGLLNLVGAGYFNDGAKTFMQYEVTSIEPVPGDKYLCYILKFNSHDGSLAAGYCATTIRVACRNSFRTALSSKASQILSARHTKNLVVNLESIMEALDLVNGGFLATEEKLKQLAAITIQSEDQIRKIVKNVFSQKDNNVVDEEEGRKPRVLEPVTNLFHNGKGQDIEGVKGTGLAMFNAITEYTNHIQGSERVKASSADSRLDSVLFGQSARLNQKAMDVILASV